LHQFGKQWVVVRHKVAARVTYRGEQLEARNCRGTVPVDGVRLAHLTVPDAVDASLDRPREVVLGALQPPRAAAVSGVDFLGEIADVMDYIEVTLWISELAVRRPEARKPNPAQPSPPSKSRQQNKNAAQ
jgi:hypothetical protein